MTLLGVFAYFTMYVYHFCSLEIKYRSSITAGLYNYRVFSTQIFTAVDTNIHALFSQLGFLKKA